MNKPIVYLQIFSLGHWKTDSEPDTVVHTSNPGIQKAEAEGQSGLHSEILSQITKHNTTQDNK